MKFNVCRYGDFQLSLSKMAESHGNIRNLVSFGICSGFIYPNKLEVICKMNIPE